MKTPQIPLRGKISELIRKYHSLHISVRIVIFLLVLAFLFWLLWSLNLIGRITSFGYLNKEVSNIIIPNSILDSDYDFLKPLYDNSKLVLKDRLVFWDAFINAYFLGLLFLKSLFFVVLLSFIVIPIMVIIVFFQGLFTANWMYVILGPLGLLVPLVLTVFLILDFFIMYFGFLFQSATPMYILTWMVIGLITGPLAGLVATVSDIFSPAPVIGRVFTSGIFGEEKWVIKGED